MGDMTPRTPSRDGESMHLGVSVIGVGSHPAAWRTRPADAPGFADVEHYQQVAQLAEQGLFDVVLLADVPEVADPGARPPLTGLEPTVLIASMAAVTEHIGFIGTVSTTFNEPYNLARRFASLDHISGGRVSLNAVTTYSPKFAAHFGSRDLPGHDSRYARAQEFLDVMCKFWDSWDDDAVQADIETGVFADASKIHEVTHSGEWFTATGTLPIPRSPQGRPVITQAGASEQGRDLAARSAEIVYAAGVSIEDGQSYYRDIAVRAEKYERPQGTPKILVGIAPVVGVDIAEARERKAQMDALVDRSKDLIVLAARLGARVEDLELDAELSEKVVEGARSVETGSRGFAESLVDMALRERLTVRELLDRNDKFLRIVGGPTEIADVLEEWFRTGAADGFILNSDVLPSGLADFVELVVPELQRRGLFRTSYDSDSLRSMLGLEHPVNQCVVPSSDNSVGDLSSS